MTSAAASSLRWAARATCAAVAVLCASAPAPSQSTPSGQPAGLQPVDPTREDVGPLSTSRRHLPIDLRVPLGFERVYRVPSAIGATPASGTNQDKFARFSGGLAAVFPRSEYFGTEQGLVAAIPAGTVYYIGGLPTPKPWEQHQPDTAVNADRVNSKVLNAADFRAAESQLGLFRSETASVQQPRRDRTVRSAKARNQRQPPAPHVFTDTDFRNRRVRELLQAAADPAGSSSK